MKISTLKNRAFRAFALFGLVFALIITAMPAPAHAANWPTPRPKIGILTLVAKDANSDQRIGAAKVTVTTGDAIVIVGETNAKGLFEAKLPQGLYDVTVTANDYSPYAGPFKIAGGQTTDVEAPMAAIIRPGVVVVYAFDAFNNIPVAGATVEIWDLTGNAIYNGQTDEGGWFTMELMPGLYHLRVTAADFYKYDGDFKLAPAQKTAIDVALTAVVHQGTVSFNVFDEEAGAVIPMALITMRNFDK